MKDRNNKNFQQFNGIGIPHANMFIKDSSLANKWPDIFKIRTLFSYKKILHCHFSIDRQFLIQLFLE